MSTREVIQDIVKYAQKEDKTIIQSIEKKYSNFKEYKNKKFTNNGEQSEGTTKKTITVEDAMKMLYLQLCVDQKRMSQNQMKLIEKQEKQNPKLQSEIMKLNQKLQTQNDMLKQKINKLQTKVQNLTKQQQQQSQVKLNKLKMQVKQIQQKFENEYNPQTFAKQKLLKEKIINLKNNNKNLETNNQNLKKDNKNLEKDNQNLKKDNQNLKEKINKLSERYDKEIQQNTELKKALNQYYKS